MESARIIKERPRESNCGEREMRGEGEEKEEKERRRLKAGGTKWAARGGDEGPVSASREGGL
jgi:hypothetical protein